MSAAHASVAYVHNDAFCKVQRYPYILTQGDIHANLADFAKVDFDTIRDHTAKKIYVLLDAGWDRAKLINALMLLRDHPWSVQLVEKAHAAGACYMPLHKNYGSTLLG